MEFLNNCSTLEILINENEFKKIAIVFISAKDINHLSLTYLNINGEIRDRIINCPENINVEFNKGDFLLYDGKTLYILTRDHVLLPIDNSVEAINLDPKSAQEIKDAGLALDEEINKQNGLKR